MIDHITLVIKWMTTDYGVTDKETMLLFRKVIEVGKQQPVRLTKYLKVENHNDKKF